MKTLITAMLALIVVAYVSHAYLYFYESGLTGFKPLYWYLITLGTAVWVILINRQMVEVRFPKIFLIWVIAYVSYIILNYVYSSQSVVATDILIQQVETIAVLISLALIMTIDNGINTARVIILTVVVFAVVLNFIDFIMPSWSNVPGRAAGLYVNANTAGKVIVLAMVASIQMIPSRLRLMFCLYVGLGVLLTFSRSSWLLWAFCVIGLAITGHLSFRHKRFGFALVAMFSAFTVFSLITGGVVHLFESAGINAYLTDNTLSRLGGGGSVFKDDSAASRMIAASMAFDVFQDHIWFGQGIGFTREWAYSVMPHNMYLITAAEGGIIGLILLVWFFGLLWRMGDKIGKLLVAGIAFYSFFSHTMLTQPSILVFFALIVASYRPYQSEATSADDTQNTSYHYHPIQADNVAESN